MVENKYTFPKKQFSKNDVKEMELFFDNGDAVKIKYSEIVNISKFEYYDRLVSCGLGVGSVVKSGTIKLNVCNKQRYAGEFYNKVYNEKELLKNRKKYIENRCVNESKITKVWFYDENNWHYVLMGNIKAKIENEFLILDFLSDESMGEFLSEEHFVYLPEIKKEDIFKVTLDFENCDMIDVYKDEILDIDLNFQKELVWGAGDILRQVENGYMIIKFSEDYKTRHYSMIEDKKYKIKDFIYRICGKKGYLDHDICHLYIKKNKPGHGCNYEECIDIDDIRPFDDKELNEKYDNDGYWYIGGFAKKLKNESIVIWFGKDFKNLEKFN